MNRLSVGHVIINDDLILPRFGMLLESCNGPFFRALLDRALRRDLPTRSASGLGLLEGRCLTIRHMSCVHWNVACRYFVKNATFMQAKSVDSGWLPHRSAEGSACLQI
jgi:hypothetical protein